MKTDVILKIAALYICLYVVNACQSPDEIKQARYFVNGKYIYEKRCQNCHGPDGEGLANLYPSIQKSLYISEKTDWLACNIRYGLNSMPANKELTPIEISYIINYIGNYFDNSIGFYSLEQTTEDLKNCK